MIPVIFKHGEYYISALFFKKTVLLAIIIFGLKI